MNKDTDQLAYRLAFEYLESFNDEGITKAIIEDHIEPSDESLRPASLMDVYQRLLISAQNRNMGAAVIGKSIGGIENLDSVLCNFNPVSVIAKFGNDANEVLEKIKIQLKPRGQIRESSRSLWPMYCRTILSAARFVAQFASVEDFCKWIAHFDDDDRARPALPLLISQEVAGIGFSLACDFLKEIGYRDFGKPDVHIKSIFKGTGLVSEDANDFRVFKAIVRVAASNKVRPYRVDKLFWLVGSGYFYNNPEIGKNGRIKTDRKRFVAWASEQIEKPDK